MNLCSGDTKASIQQVKTKFIRSVQSGSSFVVGLGKDVSVKAATATKPKAEVVVKQVHVMPKQHAESVQSARGKGLAKKKDPNAIQAMNESNRRNLNSQLGPPKDLSITEFGYVNVVGKTYDQSSIDELDRRMNMAHNQINGLLGNSKGSSRENSRQASQRLKKTKIKKEVKLKVSIKPTGKRSLSLQKFANLKRGKQVKKVFESHLSNFSENTSSKFRQRSFDKTPQSSKAEQIRSTYDIQDELTSMNSIKSMKKM